MGPCFLLRDNAPLPVGMHLVSLTPTQWLLCAVVAACAGMAKSGFSGLGTVGLVIMALVLPARESTGVLLTILIAADVFAVRAFHRHAEWRLIVRLLPPALVGILCGWWLMPRVPDAGFRPLLGGLILALTALLLVQRARPQIANAVAGHRGLAWGAGWMGGVTTMVANAAGPVMSLYLLACRLPKMAFVGTSAWFFFVINLSKVPFSIQLGLITRDSLLLTLALLPAVALGAFCGRWLLGRINQRLFEALLIAFTVLAALRLLLG